MRDGSQLFVKDKRPFLPIPRHFFISKQRKHYKFIRQSALRFALNPESMKNPTKPIPSLLLKALASNKGCSKPSHHHNLFSQSRFTPSLPSSSSSSSSLNRVISNEFLCNSFRGSSKEQKPISIYCPISSDQLLKHQSLSTRLVNSSKKPQSICKIKFSNTFLVPFSQKRQFSVAPPTDHFSKEAATSASDNFVSGVSSPIDAAGSMRKPISLWPGTYHSPVTNALWEARSSIYERLNNGVGDAPSQSQGELVAKPPSKSRTSIVYNFSSDYVLREQYRNPWNEIRMGKLLEDLDALAGTISMKHCSNDGMTRPLLLVTASVDKIVLKKPIRVDTDLTIAGAVTWVGRSSLEIQLEVTQPQQERSDPSDSVALTATFTFVARDSTTGKSAPVNQISPKTEKEQLLWEEAEERNRLRKTKKADKKRETDEVETYRLNELLAEGRIFSDLPALADRDSILIRDTCLQNSLICQPQQRNIHGRIFGGFLMRRAFELGYATAYSFAGSAPLFFEVDHVDFLKPVDVGNFLRFKSCVLYTEHIDTSQPLINVEVVAHVTRPELRSSEVSNKFYFTFTVRQDAMRNGLKIRNVVPASEEEARRVIERMDAEKCRI